MSGVICVSVCLCVCILDVSTLTENDERSTIGIKLEIPILRFCGGDFVGGLKILFSADSGFVCIPFYICCVFFMMVWYGAFRSLNSERIPHFGEDAEYPFIFWMFLAGYCLVNYCMCVNTERFARGSGSVLSLIVMCLR
jgi:hypothetical protein